MSKILKVIKYVFLFLLFFSVLISPVDVYASRLNSIRLDSSVVLDDTSGLIEGDLSGYTVYR
jgi:hypothetical protein